MLRIILHPPPIINLPILNHTIYSLLHFIIILIILCIILNLLLCPLDCLGNDIARYTHMLPSTPLTQPTHFKFEWLILGLIM